MKYTYSCGFGWKNQVCSPQCEKEGRDNRKNDVANIIIRANITEITVILASVPTSSCFLSIKW